jgi:ankyrin repeat protein
MSVTTNASRERRREYLRAVSMAVPTHTVNSAFRLVAWPTERMFRTYNADGDDQIALPLAVALCDADLVRKIHNTGVDIWKPTAAFGLPLRVAIDTENLDIINLVLKLSEQGHTTVPLGKQGSLLSKEIAHMYRKLAELRADIPAQNDHHLKTLIIWYLSHFGQPTVQVGEAIMGWSIEKKDIRLFERAINLGLTFPLKRVYGQGFITRIPSSTNQRRKFLNILLHQDEINGRQSHFDYENHSALLTCAISTNNIDLVRTVLDMGCDPDGVLQDPTRDRHREWPLREALRQGHINIIRLLLDRGADPEGCRSPGFTDRLPAGVFSLTVDSEVRELLANAIYAKIIREGPDGYTRSPNFNHYCREILDIIPRHLISKRFWDVVYR